MAPSEKRDGALVFTEHLLLGYGRNKAIDTERSQLDISLTSPRTSLVSCLENKSISTLSPSPNIIWRKYNRPALTAMELDSSD